MCTSHAQGSTGRKWRGWDWNPGAPGFMTTMPARDPRERAVKLAVSRNAPPDLDSAFQIWYLISCSAP